MIRVRSLLCFALVTAASPWLAGCASTPSGADPAAVAALAPTGKLRVALYLGSPTSLVRNPATGETKGVGLDLGRAMAEKLGVPFELAEFPNNAAALDAVKDAHADFAFTNASPARMKDMDFSQPLIDIEQGYLVPAGSALANAGAVDRPGVRVGVSKGSTSERELTGVIKAATLVPVASLREGREMLAAGKLDAYATNKAILNEMADGVPGSRILDGRYGLESLAIGIPKGREAGHSWLRTFAESARADGTVKRAAERAGLRGSSEPPVPAVAADSPRWELQGRAEVADYQGRKSLLLDGGAAVLKDLELRDGVIDVDVSTPASRGFFGIQFRIAGDDGNAEWVYLRQHKSGAPDAMQYTPVLNTGLNWQIYSGPGFTGAVDIPKNVWFHLRLEVSGAQAKLYVGNMDKPALVMPDLKSGIQKGQVALASLTGASYFSNFEIRTTPDAPWRRQLPTMPPGTLTQWSLSPSYDALSRNLERPLAPSESDRIAWQDVEAEPPGFVVINRYRESPHPRVSFANDFAKRLEPQPGMKVVYARSRIDSDRDQVKKLYLGYSDDVSVFLNGKILYRGRSAQNFRDPAFLGIVDPENDALYLPLKKGGNELVLAVSELGGGWGFICRLADLQD